MNLFKLEEFDNQYRQTFGEIDLRQFYVYTNWEEPIGQVADVLVDETGQLYHLVVNLETLPNIRQVVLPLQYVQVDRSRRRLYVDRITQAQATNLPTYNPAQVRSHANLHPNDPVQSVQPANRPIDAGVMLPIEVSAPLEAAAPLGTSLVHEPTLLSSHPVEASPSIAPVHSVSQVHEINPQIQQSIAVPAPANPVLGGEVVQEDTIQLLEERLVVGQRRRKVGDVIVRKVIETEMVQVPVRREKLIVEQISPEARQLAAIDLGQGEVSGVELREALSSRSVSPSISPTAFSTARLLPVKTAAQLLEGVASQAGYETAKVRIEFEDAKLQALYQQWLTRNSEQMYSSSQ